MDILVFLELLHRFGEKSITALGWDPLGFHRISLFEESLECL